MKKLSIILLLFLAVCILFGSTTEAATEASVMASINTNVLTRIIQQALPDLFNEVKKLTFPPISGKKLGVKYGVDNIRISSLTMNSFNVIADNGIIVDFSNFDIGLEADATYKILFFKRARCRASASINKTSLNIKLILKPQSNGKVDASVVVQKLTIPNAKVKLHGSFISKIIQVIVNAFVKIIRNGVDKMKGTLIKSMQNAFEKLLQNTYLYIPISTWGKMDFSLTKNVSYSQGNIITAFDGKTIPIGYENDKIPEEPRHHITLDPHSNLIQAKFTPFFFNSFFKAFYLNEASKSYQTLTHNNPKGFPFPLKLNSPGSDEWNQVSPEILKKYKNNAMSVKMSLFSQPRVSFKPGVMSLSIDPKISFCIDINEKCAEIFSIRGVTNISSSISIARDNDGKYVIFFQFTSINIKFQTIDSLIGPINFDGINILTQFILDFFLTPMINSAFDKGIPLPSSDKLHFIGTKFTILQDELYFTTDIQYSGQTPSPRPPRPRPPSPTPRPPRPPSPSPRPPRPRPPSPTPRPPRPGPSPNPRPRPTR